MTLNSLMSMGNTNCEVQTDPLLNGLISIFLNKYAQVLLQSRFSISEFSVFHCCTNYIWKGWWLLNYDIKMYTILFRCTQTYCTSSCLWHRIMKSTTGNQFSSIQKQSDTEIFTLKKKVRCRYINSPKDIEM